MPLPTAVADVRRIARGPVRRLFLGQLLNSLGNGLTLALLVVYLTEVRDLPVSTATGLLAWQAVLALSCSPLSGTLVDRFGPRPILLGAVLLTALGVLGYGFVTTTGQAFAAMTIVAIAGSGIWGPASALTARLVPTADRATAFGFSFMLLNLGLGLGGLISSTIVDLEDASTFQLLYTLTSLGYIAVFLAVLSMGNVGRRPYEEAFGEPAQEPLAPPPLAPEGGWLDVLRDRTLLRYAAAGLLMLTFGYGSIDAGLSLYITSSVGLDERYIGIVFAANTAVIVVMQLFVLSLISGRSRSRVLAGVGLLWGTSWLLFGSALGIDAEWAAVAVLVMAIAVFAIGETMWSPVAPALLNDLAPEHLRGRYNSVQSLLWGVSGALGPLMTGAFFSAELDRLWTLALAAGCGVAALIALQIGRSLTPEQDGRGVPVEVPTLT